MIEEDAPKVLCVDDEPQVLQGLERTLFEHFDVTTAESGQEALEIMDEDGPFPVVVSDMRMPEMDGAAFLTEARKRSPDTVRILLTGHADMDSAIAAVNHGNIYRFLCKPCDKSVLVQTLQDSVEMYRLLTLERELLEKTLNGAVKMMADLLEMVVPAAFHKANAMHGYVSHVCKALAIEDAWIFESAALLSRSGYVVLPGEIADKADAGKELNEAEQKMLSGAYQTAAKLVRDVPRLSPVADIIETLGAPRAERNDSTEQVKFGVTLLETADKLERLQRGGATMAEAMKKVDGLDAKTRVALLKYVGRAQVSSTSLLKVNDLQARMVLDQDVVSNDNMVVAKKGHELTAPMIERIKNFDRSRGIQQPIRVALPESS